MGLEARCEVEHGGRRSAGRALLEPAEVRFDGEFELRIPLAGLAAEAKGGQLCLRWGRERAVFTLGARAAEKWALQIRYPRGLMDKLGVKPGFKVSALGLPADVVAQMKARDADVSSRLRKDSDLVFVLMQARGDLARLADCRGAIKPAGAVWVIWPKGRKEFREDDARAAGPGAGLVDVKVASVSDVLSGLKMVIPLALR